MQAFIQTGSLALDDKNFQNMPTGYLKDLDQPWVTADYTGAGNPDHSPWLP